MKVVEVEPVDLKGAKEALEEATPVDIIIADIIKMKDQDAEITDSQLSVTVQQHYFKDRQTSLIRQFSIIFSCHFFHCIDFSFF